MYCPVVYGYRNEFAGFLNTMPSVYGDLLEQLGEVPLEPPRHHSATAETMRRRVLFCGSLVSIPIAEWLTWTTRNWRAVLRGLKGAQPKSLRDVEAYIREGLSVENAEYLLTVDRGAGQMRDFQLHNIDKAAQMAVRVADRVGRCLAGDGFAATMVGTSTFLFLRRILPLTCSSYMEFFEELIAIGRT